MTICGPSSKIFGISVRYSSETVQKNLFCTITRLFARIQETVKAGLQNAARLFLFAQYGDDTIKNLKHHYQGSKAYEDAAYQRFCCKLLV